MSKQSPAEATSVTPATVVTGLGYPNGREELSPNPTGWQPQQGEISQIEKKVSRETIR
ncbi:MAG: hypothetical protein ACKOFA_06335 [Rhodoluna sp.]